MSSAQATGYVRTLSLDPKTVTIPERFGTADAEHAESLGESIEQRGQSQPIGVSPERVLLWGHHRLLGCLSKRLPVRAEEWDTDSPEKAEALSIEENLRRREVSSEERAAGTRRLVEIEQGISGTEFPKITSAESQEKRGRGRPRSPRAEAERKVAEKIGVTPRQVRKSTKKPKADEATPAVTKDALGNELPPDVAASYLAAQALCDAVENALNTAKSAYTRHAKQITGDLNGSAAAILGNLGGLGAKIDREVTLVAHVARSHRPYALCPSCKLHPGGTLPSGKTWPGRAECGMCRGTGWVGEGLIKRTERVLLAYGKGAVTFIDGDAVKLAEIA